MKTIVLTDTTSGIGLEVARELLYQGHRVISGARNMKKTKIIEVELINTTENELLEFFEADFANFESIKRFTGIIKEKYKSLNVLINNTGNWEVVFKETANGIETNLQVNHLSAMLLTLELIPLLLKSNSSRIINTSSGLCKNILVRQNGSTKLGWYP